MSATHLSWCSVRAFQAARSVACEKPGIVSVGIGDLFLMGVSCLRCRVRSCATGSLSTKGKLGDVAGRWDSTYRE
jgi:hypothetical protein